jgi:hypothetical protein
MEELRHGNSIRKHLLPGLNRVADSFLTVINGMKKYNSWNGSRVPINRVCDSGIFLMSFWCFTNFGKQRVVSLTAVEAPPRERSASLIGEVCAQNN